MPELSTHVGEDLQLAPLRKFLQSTAGLNSLYLSAHEKQRGLHWFNDNYSNPRQLQRLKNRCMELIEEKTKKNRPDLSDSKSLAIQAADDAEHFNPSLDYD